MIYLSAGHHLADSGAVGNGYKENELTIELRDLIAQHLDDVPLTLDDDSKTLSQYLASITPTDTDVVVEIHFNAASATATGAEVLIADNHNKESKALAQELSLVTASNLCIRNRGVKTESDSARGRLAFVRNKGACALMEICFISNKSDMDSYQENKEILARAIAYVLKKHHAAISV